MDKTLGPEGEVADDNLLKDWKSLFSGERFFVTGCGLHGLREGVGAEFSDNSETIFGFNDFLELDDVLGGFEFVEAFDLIFEETFLGCRLNLAHFDQFQGELHTFI